MTLALTLFIAGIVLLYYHVHDTAQRSDDVNIGYVQIGLLVVFGIMGFFAAVRGPNTRRSTSAGGFGLLIGIIGFIGMIKYYTITLGNLSVAGVLTAVIMGIIGVVVGFIIGAISGGIHKCMGGLAAGSILGLVLLFFSQPFNPNVTAGKLAGIDATIMRHTERIEEGLNDASSLGGLSIDSLYQFRGNTYMARGELSNLKSDFDHAAADFATAIENSPYNVRTRRYRDLLRKANNKSKKAKIRNVENVENVQSAGTTGTVISAAANIRSAPDSSKNNVITQMKKGDVLTVTGSVDNGWLPVEVDGQAGYVSADLVELTP
jgi:hypothetical protein